MATQRPEPVRVPDDRSADFGPKWFFSRFRLVSFIAGPKEEAYRVGQRTEAKASAWVPRRAAGGD
jgi:hypothetical protein